MERKVFYEDSILDFLKREEDYSEEDDYYCYECGSYGDDYYYDEQTGQLKSSCDDCPYNRLNWED